MCIADMDGKLIKIMPRPYTGSTFYNLYRRFQHCSISCHQCQSKFIYVDVGTNGRISDSRVWTKTKFKKAIDSDSLNIPRPIILPGTKIEVPFVLVADDAFTLTHWIMKPFPGYSLGKRKENF